MLRRWYGDAKLISLSQYLAYYYNVGLERPNLDDKMLFNQVSFSDACNFNNVYLFCVPKLGAIENETTPIDLFFAQKQAIVDKLDQYKMVFLKGNWKDPYITRNIVSMSITKKMKRHFAHLKINKMEDFRPYFKV